MIKRPLPIAILAVIIIPLIVVIANVIVALTITPGYDTLVSAQLWLTNIPLFSWSPSSISALVTFLALMGRLNRLNKVSMLKDYRDETKPLFKVPTANSR
jgi:hypothetical protein